MSKLLEVKNEAGETKYVRPEFVDALKNEGWEVVGDAPEAAEAIALPSDSKPDAGLVTLTRTNDAGELEKKHVIPSLVDACVAEGWEVTGELPAPSAPETNPNPEHQATEALAKMSEGERQTFFEHFKSLLAGNKAQA